MLSGGAQRHASSWNLQTKKIKIIQSLKWESNPQPTASAQQKYFLTTTLNFYLNILHLQVFFVDKTFSPSPDCDSSDSGHLYESLEPGPTQPPLPALPTSIPDDDFDSFDSDTDSEHEKVIKYVLL